MQRRIRASDDKKSSKYCLSAKQAPSKQHKESSGKKESVKYQASVKQWLRRWQVSPKQVPSKCQARAKQAPSKHQASSEQAPAGTKKGSRLNVVPSKCQTSTSAKLAPNKSPLGYKDQKVEFAAIQ